MFSVPQEIEVTEKMLKEGCKSFNAAFVRHGTTPASDIIAEIYRAMEKARREGTVKVSWSEPDEVA